jgi:hypothetical protein
MPLLARSPDVKCTVRLAAIQSVQQPLQPDRSSEQQNRDVQTSDLADHQGINELLRLVCAMLLDGSMYVLCARHQLCAPLPSLCTQFLVGAVCESRVVLLTRNKKAM